MEINILGKGDTNKKIGSPEINLDQGSNVKMEDSGNSDVPKTREPSLTHTPTPNCEKLPQPEKLHSDGTDTTQKFSPANKF